MNIHPPPPISALATALNIRRPSEHLQLGRGPLGQKVAKNAFSWHPSGEHLVCGLFERHIATLRPKKVPKRKTCQILRKRVICDYLLLNYRKKIQNFEFNNNKNDLHHEKEHKKLHIGQLNSFSFFEFSFLSFELFLF